MHRGVIVATLTADDVRDIYRTRTLIETGAVLRGDYSSTGALDAMEEAVGDLRAATAAGDWQLTVSADFTFHTRLVGSLQMRRLQAFHASTLLARLGLRLALVRLDSSVGDARTWASQHDEICRLLRAGRRRDCARVVEQHLKKSEDQLIEVVATVVSGPSAAAITDARNA